MCVSLDILLFADNETRTTLVDTITSLRTENWSEEKANTLVDVMASTPIRGNHLRNIREMMSSLNFHIVKYRGVSDFSKKINSIVSKTSNIVKANYLVVLTWCMSLPDFPQFPPKSDVINKIEIDKFRDIDVTVTKKRKQEISKETTYPDSLLKYEIHFDNHKYTFLDLLENNPVIEMSPKRKGFHFPPRFSAGVKLPTVRTYIVEKPDDLNGWTNKKIEGYNWIVYKDPNDDTTTALMPTKISPGGPYFLKDMGDENHNENVEAINLSYIMPEILPAVKVSHVQVLSQNQYDVFTDVVMNLLIKTGMDDEIKKKVRNHMVKSTNKGNRHHMLLFDWVDLVQLKDLGPKDPLFSSDTFKDDFLFHAWCNTNLPLLEFNAQNLAVHGGRIIRYDFHIDDTDQAFSRRTNPGKRGLCTGGKIRKDFLDSASAALFEYTDASLCESFDKLGQNLLRLCVCCDGEPKSEGDQKNLPWVHASYPFRHDVLFGTIDKLVKFHSKVQTNMVTDKNVTDEQKGVLYREYFEKMIQGSRGLDAKPLEVFRHTFRTIFS